jgi:hypothetical protein
MTKTFTKTDGTTTVVDTETTTAAVRDPINGQPVMKLITPGESAHRFVFGHPADLCDAELDHTVTL